MNEALKAFEYIAWGVETSIQHPATGENLLVNDFAGKECNIVRLALSRPTFEDAVKVVEKRHEKLVNSIEYQASTRNGALVVLENEYQAILSALKDVEK